MPSDAALSPWETFGAEDDFERLIKMFTDGG